MDLDYSKVKKQKVMIFFIGVVVCFILILSIEAILDYLDRGTALTNKPKIFGNIKIWVQKEPETSKIFSQRLNKKLTQLGESLEMTSGESLEMTRNNILLMRMFRNDVGQVEDLLLFNKNRKKPFLHLTWNKDTSQIRALYLCNENSQKLILIMIPLPSGELGYAMYTKGKAVGDVLVDIDFDGRFDVKVIFNRDRKPVSHSIFINEAWQRVDYYDGEGLSAASGETNYIFDLNFGWRKKRK